MKKLILEKLISTGRTRLIYEHPEDEKLLVKVPRPYSVFGDSRRHISARALLKTFMPNRFSGNKRELAAYKKTKILLSDYLPKHGEFLVETNFGKGLVAQKIIDECGRTSIPLETYLTINETIDAALLRAFEQFFQTLITHRLYFYDFNRKNFVIQQNNSDLKLFFTDLKGYRKDRALIPLTCLHPNIAKAKMLRRINAFHETYLKRTS